MKISILNITFICIVSICVSCTNNDRIFKYIEKNEIGKLQSFMESNGDILLRNSQGLTLMDLAIEEDRGEIVELLLDHGYPTDINGGESYFHLAAMKGSIHSLHQFILHGIDIETPDIDGATALLVAVYYDRLKCALLLGSYGADPLARYGLAGNAFGLASTYKPQNIQVIFAWNDIMSNINREVLFMSDSQLVDTLEGTWYDEYSSLTLNDDGFVSIYEGREKNKPLLHGEWKIDDGILKLKLRDASGVYDEFLTIEYWWLLLDVSDSLFLHNVFVIDETEDLSDPPLLLKYIEGSVVLRKKEGDAGSAGSL